MEGHYKDTIVQNNQTSSNSGFTLVELAIALIVIGLLIGAVLKADEMIEQARSTQFVRQIQAYETANKAFIGLYNEMPGDIRDPDKRVPGCTAAPCNVSGNGNWMLPTGAHGVPAIPSLTHSGNRMMVGENRNYWVHLAKAQLISGVDPDYNGVFSAKAGVEAPSAPTKQVGFGAVYHNVGSEGQAGNYYTIFHYGHGGQYMAMRGNRAFFIDQKIDDGKPFSGSVLASGHWSAGTAVPANCISGTDYNLLYKQVACNLISRFQ
jgi:prepilin-type N-terminal cleavage/methylation domain-containing protein